MKSHSRLVAAIRRVWNLALTTFPFRGETGGLFVRFAVLLLAALAEAIYHRDYSHRDARLSRAAVSHYLALPGRNGISRSRAAQQDRIPRARSTSRDWIRNRRRIRIAPGDSHFVGCVITMIVARRSPINPRAHKACARSLKRVSRPISRTAFFVHASGRAATIDDAFAFGSGARVPARRNYQCKNMGVWAPRVGRARFCRVQVRIRYLFCAFSVNPLNFCARSS